MVTGVWKSGLCHRDVTLNLCLNPLCSRFQGLKSRGHLTLDVIACHERRVNRQFAFKTERFAGPIKLAGGIIGRLEALQANHRLLFTVGAAGFASFRLGQVDQTCKVIACCATPTIRVSHTFLACSEHCCPYRRILAKEQPGTIASERFRAGRPNGVACRKWRAVFHKGGQGNHRAPPVNEADCKVARRKVTIAIRSKCEARATIDMRKKYA